MSLAVSDEAVAFLQQMSRRLLELQGDLVHYGQWLDAVYEENKVGLGRHSASIGNLIDDLSRKTKEMGPVLELSRKLRRSARIRRSDKNPYSGTSMGGVAKANSDTNYIAGVLGRMYAAGYRELRRPEGGSWTGDIYHPDPKEVPRNSNPDGKTFGQIIADLERDYGLCYSGTPFTEGFADFSSVALAQIGMDEIIGMHVATGHCPDPLLDGTAVDYAAIFKNRSVNFGYADELAARRQLPIPGLAPGYTKADLAKWRQEHGFTWDESLANGYILVPSALHNNIAHTGLVGLQTHGQQAEQNITESLRKQSENP